MVEIRRHRGGGSNYKSSQDFWSSGLPTQDNRRKKYDNKNSTTNFSSWRSLFEFQIPVWLMLLVVALLYTVNHHQEKQQLQFHHESMLQEELQRNKDDESPTKFFRRRRSRNVVSSRSGDDEDEEDLSKLATPQEDEYWLKQEDALRKEREEFELQKKAEESFLEHEREVLEHEREAITKQTKTKPIVSSQDYLTQLLERHADDPKHWGPVCAQRMQEEFISSGKIDSSNDQDKLSFLFECASEYASETLVQLNQDVSFQQKERQHVAGLLENYTCTDPDAMASPDLYPPHEWKSPHPLRYHDPPIIKVHIKHDRHASRIHLLENFIDDEECQAMEDAARSKLHVATTANGKGGSQVSDARKAMQAGIRVPWNKESDGDKIARLSRRVYDYTNHVLGLHIDEHGQEDLMSIQYKGHGFIHNPDRYTPHCDGDCTGSHFRPGTRMATVVMYCTIPTLGGATNFRNSNIHVKAKRGSAVFFSYIDPLTNMTDNRFTEHSGCPVYEGEKKIVTQWIRYGVSKEEPWTSFNTLGIKYSDASKYE